MNLYVDDQRPCPPGWTIARTIDDAIRILSDGMTGINPVEVVDMDHDIHYDFKDVETKVLDANTIYFTLKKSLPIFPTYLTRPVIKYPLLGVVGLYKVDKVKSKFGFLTEVSLIPNKKGLPHLTYKFYDTENKLINAYKRGEIHEMRTTKKTIADSFSKWKRNQQLFFWLFASHVSHRAYRH